MLNSINCLFCSANCYTIFKRTIAVHNVLCPFYLHSNEKSRKLFCVGRQIMLIFLFLCKFKYKNTHTMKFIANTSQLRKGLKAASGVIASVNTLPILDNFLFSIDNNRLTILASNIETTKLSNLNLSYVR